MSKNFQPYEFNCSCCGVLELDPHLIAVLELVRHKFNAPVVITSGYRCQPHNACVGGSKESKHIEGIAADFKVKGVEPILVYSFLDEVFPTTYGLGLYSSWVHLDVRKSRGRW